MTSSATAIDNSLLAHRLTAQVAKNCADGHHSLVGGASLSGRTTVATALANGVLDALLVIGRAELSATPFGAFVHALSGGDQLDRLAAASAWLQAHSAIVVDNPHLLDESSIAALSIAADSVPVVLVTRHNAPLLHGAARIAAAARGGCLDIEPLDKHAIDTILDTCTVPISPLARWQAGEFSHGRPGIASYLVDRAERDQSWEFLVPDIEPDRLLLDRVNSSYGLEHLKTLAVLGVVHGVSLRMLERAVGALTLERARDELIIDDNGTVRAASALIADCARQLVDTSWLLDAVSRLDRCQLDALARLGFDDVCRTDSDDDTVLTAADTAARLHRRRTALALLARVDLDCPEKTHRAALVFERLDQWSQLLDTLRPWRTQPLAPTRRARWAAMSATAAFYDESIAGQAQVAAADIEFTAWDIDPTASLDVAIERANVLWQCGRLSAAYKIVDQLGPDLDLTARVRTFGIEATRHLALGDTDWVCEHAMALTPTAIGMGGEAARTVVGVLVTVLVFEFRFDEANRLLALGEAALAPGALGARATLLAVRSAISILRGQPLAALAAIDEAIDIAHYSGDASTLLMLGALGMQAALNTASGVDPARYVSLVDNPGSSRLEISRLQSDVMHCTLRASNGDRKGAIGQLLSAAQISRTEGLIGDEIRLMHGAVCLGATTSLRSQRMHSLKREVRSPVLRLMVDRIVATERADPFGLMEVSKRFQEGGALVDAAECAMQASVAAQQAGRLDFSTECELKALAILNEMEGVDSPLLRFLRGTDNRFKLTTRERDVVRMAQQGMTNKEIASATFVGVRTVEGHLLRAYAKLGIKSRSELQASIA
jgi:DNA-binding CsgD family transcriptional regulator